MAFTRVAHEPALIRMPAATYDLPLISVIIPAYDAELFIGETLASVRAQSHTNLEVLVVDDGSSDRTVDIVNDFARQDPRFTLLRQANAGVAAARNLAISHARGHFIAPLDADDIWHPQNLERQLRRMQQVGPSVGLVYAWSVDIDEENVLTGGFCAARIQGEVYHTLLCHNFLGNASACLIRRACIDRVGGYDTDFMAKGAQGCEDWDLYLRIAEHYRFAAVPAFFIGYRKMSHSMSRDYERMARSHALIIQKLRRQRPKIRRVFCRWSGSNLYLYFANQSQISSESKATLYWLYRALKADSLIPLLRPRFYRLTIVSLLDLAIQSIGSSLRRSGSVEPCKPSRTVHARKTLHLEEVRKSCPSVGLKLWVSDRFHKVVSALKSC